MSFRDLRNFTEIMRVLGYPRLISLTNFRVPNFPLVAEILVWLVMRFNPDTDVPSDHNTEMERVLLIRSVAEFMALKINLKLNTKKLYQADGYAVKELLKIAKLLYEAQKKDYRSDISQKSSYNMRDFDITNKIQELKLTRQLGSQLTSNGAALFDLLGREIDFKEIRNSKVMKQYDISEIEMALKEAIKNAHTEIEETKVQISNIKDTEQNLEVKLERRQMELERNHKRLQSLKKVRPAFMEEFEKLEVELRLLYDDYLQKFRYLSYLEHLHEDAIKVEQERFEQRQAATKKQLEQLRAEDASFESIMEGNDSIFATNLQEPLTIENMEKQSTERPEQSRIKSGRTSRIQLSNQRKIYGSMSGRQQRTIQGSNNSADSLDSDSDLLIDGDLDDDDDDDDDDDLLNSLHGPKMSSFDTKTNKEDRTMSKIGADDDF